MQRLEVSGAVRHIYMSLGGERLRMKVICSEPMKKWSCGFGCCFGDDLCVCLFYCTDVAYPVQYLHKVPGGWTGDGAML
jgi:hypothetical protein